MLNIPILEVEEGPESLGYVEVVQVIGYVCMVCIGDHPKPNFHITHCQRGAVEN